MHENRDRGEARNHLHQLLDEALNGHPVIIARGRRRVLLQPVESIEGAREWAEFCAAFPPASREPKRVAQSIRKVIRRVRQQGERSD